jgi:secreted trypsin-like serine protease
LEGASGSGDSGGPLLIEADGKVTVAGLMSWQFATGDISDYQPGRYGQVSYLVRISHYAKWIDSVMTSQ